MKIAILYVPVLHEGYLRFFKKYGSQVEVLYLLGEDIVSEFNPKEIRAVSSDVMQKVIAALGLFKTVRVLSRVIVPELKNVEEIITANEDISKKFVAKYAPKAKVSFDTVFLRWDASSVNTSAVPEGVKVSSEQFDKDMMTRAADNAKDSSDWWRHVGAVIVKDGKVLAEGHNRHVSSEHQPYAEGDPRDYVQAGKNPEISTVSHAEMSAIGECARKGIALDGAVIYATTFPCPVCAKLIASTGIKKCYFAGGHASLDGERVLKSQGVEIIAVK